MIELTKTAEVLGSPTDVKMHDINGYARESSPPTELDSAGDQSLDCSVKSLFRKTGGNAILTFTNMVENQQINLAMESTGSSYTLAFAGETFKWGGGTQPTPSSASSKVDIYSFLKIAGVVYGNAVTGF